MTFKQFALNSSEYRRSLVLRSAVLRLPLGLELSNKDLVGEENQLHFGLFEQEEILAVVVLKPINNHTMKLRQMAVANGQQGKGLGKQLIQQAEIVASSQNYKVIEMAAREAVVPFYQSLGYQTEGLVFTEIGIPHIKMTKAL